MKRVVLLSVVCLAAAAGLGAQAPPAAKAGKTLEIYVADTEGGKAALFVSPTGQTLLIDSGNPGERDLTRIMAMIGDAGVKQIDYLISTHYHVDHIGGHAGARPSGFRSAPTSITARTPSPRTRWPISRPPTSRSAARPSIWWSSRATASPSPASTGASSRRPARS